MNPVAGHHLVPESGRQLVAVPGLVEQPVQLGVAVAHARKCCPGSGNRSGVRRSPSGSRTSDDARWSATRRTAATSSGKSRVVLGVLAGHARIRTGKDLIGRRRQTRQTAGDVAGAQALWRHREVGHGDEAAVALAQRVPPCAARDPLAQDLGVGHDAVGLGTIADSRPAPWPVGRPASEKRAAPCPPLVRAAAPGASARPARPSPRRPAAAATCHPARPGRTPAHGRPSPIRSAATTSRAKTSIVSPPGSR